MTWKGFGGGQSSNPPDTKPHESFPNPLQADFVWKPQPNVPDVFLIFMPELNQTFVMLFSPEHKQTSQLF